MNTPQNLLAHLRNAETNHIGFSYNINNGDSKPETGYMVSRKGYEQTAPQGCDLVAYGRNYFLLHAEQLADPTAYMVCLHNGGRFVFDICDNIAMMDNAIEMGMRNNQEAIWDCASGSEYRLMREGDAEKTYTKDELYATMRSFIEDTRGDKPWVDADDEWFEQFTNPNTKGLLQSDNDPFNRLVTIYYNDVFVSEEPNEIYANCPYVNVPIMDAINYAERMIENGDWDAYCIPELCNHKVVFQGDTDAYNENAIEGMLEAMYEAIDEFEGMYNHCAGENKDHYETRIAQLNNVLNLLNSLK